MTNRNLRPWPLLSAVVVALVTGACAVTAEDEAAPPTSQPTSQQPSEPAPRSGAGEPGILEPGRTSEPEPPDWLQITPVSEDLPVGETAFDVEIRPEADADVELEIVTPGLLRFASGARSRTYAMRRDGPPARERLSMTAIGTPGTSVTVRLRVLDGDGNPTMIVDRSITFGPRATAPGQERVPVVLTRPDGSRIVEHITRAEARRQGLSIDDTVPALQGDPAAAPDETDTPPDAGGDRRPDSPAR